MTSEFFFGGGGGGVGDETRSDERSYLGTMTQSRPQLRNEFSFAADGQFEEEEGNGGRYVSVGYCSVCVCVKL